MRVNKTQVRRSRSSREAGRRQIVTWGVSNFCEMGVLYMFLLALWWSLTLTALNSLAASTFECKYVACLLNKRNGKAAFGCSSGCLLDGVPMLHGDCDSENLDSAWRRFVHDDGTLYSAVILSGIRTYARGYGARFWAARLRSWSSGQMRSEGSFRCDKLANGSLNTSIYFKLDTQEYQYTTVLRNDSLPAHWTSTSKRRAEFIADLGSRSAFDHWFLHSGCPRFLRLPTTGSTATGFSGILLRGSLCDTRYLMDSWRTAMLNRQLYGEIEGRGISADYYLSDFEREKNTGKINTKKKNKGKDMIGMFVIVCGGFAVVFLFCFLVNKQKRNLIKDFKKRQDSLRTGRPIV